MHEFDLIARIRARGADREFDTARFPGRNGVRIGIGDDAALLSPQPGMELAMSVDTLVRGVHYPVDATPADIGWKALAVNLSDLAAMGAEPLWALLSLTVPQAHGDWLDGFLDGWCALATASGIVLVGGDTTCGPEAVSVTVVGQVPAGAALLRSGACAGDRVWVSGSLGDAAAALQVPALARDARLAERLHRPQPRLALGRALRGVANACIDLSDGLLADLSHLATASGLAAELSLEALPASGGLQALAAPERWPLQLAGGDDYELCFTAPVSRDDAVHALAAASGIALTAVGRMEVGSGVRVLHGDGREYQPPRRGYRHFD